MSYRPPDLVGHVSRAESTMSYDANRLFTITPVSGTYGVHVGGEGERLGADTVTAPATAAAGFCWIYVDTDKDLKFLTAEWDIQGLGAPTASVYWDGTAGILYEERHCPRNRAARAMHEMLHETVHMRWAYGLMGTFHATDGTFSFSTGEVYDEDIEHYMVTPTTCRIMYNNGSDVAISLTASSTKIFQLNTTDGIPQYNAAGTVTAVTNAFHGVYWVYANNEYVNGTTSGRICVMLDTVNGTLNTARAQNTPVTPANFSVGALNEWKLLHKVIYKRNGTGADYIEKVDYQTISSLPTDILTTTLPATSITVVPSGVLTSNVQTSLEALDAKSNFSVSLPAGAFNLIGAAAEPLFAATDGTNFDYPTLQFEGTSATTIWGAVTGNNVFFQIPSRRTTKYNGGDIKVDIDFLLVGGTLTDTHTVIFGVGLIEVNDAAAFDIAPPISTSGTVWNTQTYTLGASETTLYKHTITITLTADASVSAGQVWVGRLARLTSADTSVAAAYVTGITVYE